MPPAASRRSVVFDFVYENHIKKADSPPPHIGHFPPVFLEESNIITHFSEAVLLLATGFFFLHRGSAGYAGVPASPSRLTMRLSVIQFPQPGTSTRGRWRFEWPLPASRSLQAASAPAPSRSRCPT